MAVLVWVPKERPLITGLRDMSRVRLVAKVASCRVFLAAMLNLVASFFAFEATGLFAGSSVNSALKAVIIVGIERTGIGGVNCWHYLVFFENVVDVVDESQ